jgi:hypothetical protein
MPPSANSESSSNVKSWRALLKISSEMSLFPPIDLGLTFPVDTPMVSRRSRKAVNHSVLVGVFLPNNFSISRRCLATSIAVNPVAALS